MDAIITVHHADGRGFRYEQDSLVRWPQPSLQPGEPGWYRAYRFTAQGQLPVIQVAKDMAEQVFKNPTRQMLSTRASAQRSLNIGDVVEVAWACNTTHVFGYTGVGFILLEVR